MSQLTAIYIAIGARDALRDASDAPALSRLIDSFSGELNLLEELSEDAAMLDALAEDVCERIGGVFVYEVAEPYGTAVIHALLRGEEPDKRTIATELLAEILIN